MKKITNLIDPERSFIAKLFQFLSNVDSARSLASTLFGLLTTFGTVSLTAFDILSGKREFVSAVSGIAEIGLAIRLLLMILVAGALGAGLGGLSFYLTRKNTGTRAIIVSFLGIAWAFLLVASAQALANTSGRSAFPEFALFLTLGLGLCMWLLTYQMRAQSGQGAPAMVEDRANMLALFVTTTILGGLLISVSEIG